MAVCQIFARPAPEYGASLEMDKTKRQFGWIQQLVGSSKWPLKTTALGTDKTLY